jgi:cell wall-associated NlpC family hydrolase
LVTNKEYTLDRLENSIHDLEAGKITNKPMDGTSPLERQKRKFIKVNAAQLGDVMSINIKGMPCHVGIYIDDKTFLHTMKKIGSVIDRLDKWQKRIEGYYRWPR